MFLLLDSISNLHKAEEMKRIFVSLYLRYRLMKRRIAILGKELARVISRGSIKFPAQNSAELVFGNVHVIGQNYQNIGSGKKKQGIRERKNEQGKGLPVDVCRAIR